MKSPFYGYYLQFLAQLWAVKRVTAAKFKLITRLSPPASSVSSQATQALVCKRDVWEISFDRKTRLLTKITTEIPQNPTETQTNKQTNKQYAGALLFSLKS